MQDDVASEDPGPLLTRQREALGLDSDYCAQILGCSLAELRGFEAGTSPSGDVLARIEAFERLPADSVYADQFAGTMPAYARLIKQELESGADENADALLRLVIQLSDDFGYLKDPADRDFFLREPASTGSPRFDALLAGVAVHLCRMAAMDRCPAWVLDPSRYLDRFWWYGIAGEVPSLRALAFQNTPSCLKSRGVIFNARNLESV